jgi:hypothetical protein
MHGICGKSCHSKTKYTASKQVVGPAGNEYPLLVTAPRAADSMEHKWI